MAAFCLFGLSGVAWAASDVEASKACVKCHDEDDLPDMRASAHGMHERMGSRPMGFAGDPRTPTCVSCHGPSTAHLERASGGRPAPDRVFGRKSAVGDRLELTRRDRLNLTHP